MAELHESLFSKLEKLHAESDEHSGKGNRRRPQKDRPIYTPGSGPLKKSDNCDEEFDQPTPTNKTNKRNQKSEGSKEGKVTSNSDNRSHGGKKDHVQQSAQNDKKNYAEKKNSKNSSFKSDLNSKDNRSKKAPNVSQSLKAEILSSKEPHSDFEDKNVDKQKNRKPDSQIYVVPKSPAPTSNISEPLSDPVKESQADSGKNNKTYPKQSKFKSNNYRNEPNKNFGRPHSEHIDIKRTQGQKFSKENEDSSSKSNPKGSDDSIRSKPFRDGRNRNFSHSSCDDSSRPSPSFHANKLPHTLTNSEPGNKPSNYNNSGTNSTNLSSNYDNKHEHNSGYPPAQNQEFDASKPVRQFSDSKSSLQQNPSHGVSTNRNSKNLEPATTADNSWHGNRNVPERRPPPNRNSGYDRGHSFKRNSAHDRGPYNGRGHFPGRGSGHDRELHPGRGSGHDREVHPGRGSGHDRELHPGRGSGHDRELHPGRGSGHDREVHPGRGSGHDRELHLGRGSGHDRELHPERGSDHDRELHPDRGPNNDRGPPPERGLGNDRGPAPERRPGNERGPPHDRAPGNNRGPPERVPGNNRGPAPERGPVNHRVPAPERGLAPEKGPVNDRGPAPDWGTVNDKPADDWGPVLDGPAPERGSVNNKPADDWGPAPERVSVNDKTADDWGPVTDKPAPEWVPGNDRPAPERGPVNDRGPPPERGRGNDRGTPHDKLPSHERVHLPDRGHLYGRGSDRRYPSADRRRHVVDRGHSSHDKGFVVGQGYNTAKGAIPDSRLLQNQDLPDRGPYDTRTHDPRLVHGRSSERIHEMNKYGASENKLLADRAPRNDRSVSKEQNFVPEKDAFERIVVYDSSLGQDPRVPFPFDRNPAPPSQNWNSNQERNFPSDRNPNADRGPPSHGWDQNYERNYSHGRGLSYDRNQYNNKPPAQINRRPIDKGPIQDFNPKYDMPPPSHDGPPPMMSQGPHHDRHPNRDRMSNKPPMHKNSNKQPFTAPRFQRKMEENRLKNMQPDMNYIGTTSEFKWDGSSATYHSTSNTNPRENYSNSMSSLPAQFTQHPPPPYNQPNPYSQQPPPGNWALTHTLPPSKPLSRGRGYRGDALERKYSHDRSVKSLTPERTDHKPVIIRTNAQNKPYHPTNDNWKNNESGYRNDRNWEQPDELGSDNGRRNMRLMTQSGPSSFNYQGSRSSFSTSSDHSDKVNVNGNREDSSEEEDDEETGEIAGKSALQDLISMSWADVVDRNDDELNETVVNNQDQSEPVCSPTDRNSEKNKRRRKKSLSQDRLSDRNSNLSGSRQDIRYPRNESAERKEWARQKPMGNDRNHRRNNAGGWNNEPAFHRDQDRHRDHDHDRDRNRDCDRDRGGRDKRNRNRSSKRGMDKHRDRDRSERDPENWRARNDSTSDSKPSTDYESRPRDETHRKNEHGQDGSTRKESVDIPKCPSIGGILILPTPLETQGPRDAGNSSQPPPEISSNAIHGSKHLFDPNNPTKPIIVPSAHSRPGIISERSLNVSFPERETTHTPPPAGDSGSVSSKPAWYDPRSESFISAKNSSLLVNIERADIEFQWLSSNVMENWSRIVELRHYLESALAALLVFDLKFCETENIECHIWKITYHNFIELLRKLMIDNPEQKDVIRKYLLEMFEQGTEYFKRLLNTLEETYKIKFDEYVSSSEKVTGLTSIALISAQKLFIFLGDLARYKEQVNETTNYGSARQWYLKAREMNPKNGKPYNQLALIAFCSKRKIDAVYYYMRSLMASNPIQSAKESLLSIFDVNRKKYESIEKKRVEEREKKYRDKATEKESFNDRNKKRREIWIRPDCGKRKHMTLTTKEDSEDEELSLLSHIEVNKRFGVSFLHIQGKLFNKVGMETFQDAAHQMLREFRALLQHSPMALNVTRFLQLLALNMFAIENTQLKDTQLEDDPQVRSVPQELSLMVSLQMFNVILERAIQLLKEQFSAEAKGSQPHPNAVGSDLEILLPAIKIWCDWLIRHATVWNPPPSCQDYLVGPASADCWSRLATLTNYISKLDFKDSELIAADKQVEDSILVSLPEDSFLSGFSPLMPPLTYIGPTYTSKSGDLDLAQMNLRVRKVLFFTTTYLCGLEPPVLKLQKNDFGHSEYISVVETSSTSRDQSDTELYTESMSEEEDCEEIQLESQVQSESGNPEDDNVEKSPQTKETRNLLLRKEQLEKVHQKKERYEQQVNAILEQCSYSVEMEVKPKYLVPDTNCFIDYLAHLRSITKVTTATNESLYALMVPLIVQNELQGLSKGVRKSTEVAESAKEALEFLSSQSSSAVKCVTTKGAILPHACNFVEEDDSAQALKNDDKILETCINLCKSKPSEEPKEGEPRKIHRNVVLLTDDRHLRVKALCRDMPVRKVPDFIRWADLG